MSLASGNGGVGGAGGAVQAGTRSSPNCVTAGGPVLAGAALQDELDARFARYLTGLPGAVGTPGARDGSGAVPLVVTLGDGDALIDGAEISAAARLRATVSVTRQAVLIGPWGGGPGCGHCLAVRWQRMRPDLERDAMETGTDHRASGLWPIPTGFVADAVWAAYLAAYLEPVQEPAQAPVQPGGRTGGPARVTAVDLDTLRCQTYPLTPEPSCPHCGPADSGAAAAGLVLRSRSKQHPDSYRLRGVGEYDLSSRALANPICGLIGREAAAIMDSTTTAPVVGGSRLRGRLGLAEVTWSGQGNSYGASARLGFLEGLERYAGTMRRRRGGFITDSYRRLAPEALDPRDCGTYDPATYAGDPNLRPFDPDAELPWVWGWSLRDDRPLLVPARMGFYSVGTAADSFVQECSNGCASGSCLEEAILHGLLEVIERDAFLLHWYGGLGQTEIDLTRIAELPGGAPIAAMIDRARLCGYTVHAYDTRADLPVPVVTAVGVRDDGDLGALVFGAGAGLDPVAAVASAFAEIITYVPLMRRRTAPLLGELTAMVSDYSLVKELRDHSNLFCLPEMAHHAEKFTKPEAVAPLAEVYQQWQAVRPRNSDLLADVEYLRDLIAEAGSDIIVVDQTAPEQEAVGLANVRVIVPGLLPIDFGWSKQRALRLPRLLTAPRRAGLLSRDLTVGELHRVPHPFP